MMEGMHRRTIVSTIGAVALTCSAVGMYFVVSAHHGDDSQSGDVEYVPENVTRTFALDQVSDEGLDEPGALDEAFVDPDLPALDLPLVALTEPLDLDPSIPYVVGVTWEASGMVVVDARMRVGDMWQPWERVEEDTWNDVEGTVDNRGTEAYIAANATAMQFRASSDSGVPPELTVHIFSSELTETKAAGPSEADNQNTTARYEALTVSSPLTSDAPVSNPMPVIHYRSEWSPRPPSGEFDIGTVEGVIIHHTAGTNNYSAANVPAILRGIQNYHMDARGWFDTGYNFLIDKYGRIWEGRAGGVENTIRGVHGHSFNRITTGVSIMGNYDLVQPTTASVNALTDLLAWKFTLHGVSADGYMFNLLHQAYYPAIFTHRQIPEASTSCPGAYLYARLSSIRSSIISKQALPALSLNVDVTGDGVGDVIRLESGVVTVYSPGTVWAESTAGQLSTLDTGLPFEALAEGPALDGGSGVDVIVRDIQEGYLYRLPTGGVAERISTVPLAGTAETITLVSPGDVTGDSHRDLVSVDLVTGSSHLWAGDGTGAVTVPTVISGTWGAVEAVTAPGDLDSDGDSDLITVLADGGLHVVIGNGAGGFSLGPELSDGWAGFDFVIGVDDRTGDGVADLIAWNSTTGEARTILGGVAGPIGAYDIWPELQLTRPREFGPVDYSSTPRSTLIALNPRTEYWALAGLDLLTGTLWPTGLTLDAPDTVQTAIVGDVDDNGRADIITIDTTGRLWLHLRQGSGFANPIGIADPSDSSPDPLVGWADYTSIAGAGDINFDGAPDLVAVTEEGRVLIFPWSTTDPSELQFARMVALGYEDYEVFGTGSWGPNRVSDLMAIGPTGDVVLLESKGLTGARVIGEISSGWDPATKFWAVGIGTSGGYSGVIAFNPVSETFEYYTWSPESEWTENTETTDD